MQGRGSPYKPPLKWQTLPTCHCEGALRPWQSRRPVAANVGERTAGPGDALVICTNRRQNGKRSRLVIARPQRGRGALSAKREEVPLGCNLGKAVTVSPIAFPRCCRVLRDCHVASLLAMTRQGGAAMHQRPDAVELPCTRRSVSAATDAIGAHHFNDSLYELHCLPEIATSAYGLLAMTSRGLSPF